mgnify:CR=1 FL=1
MSGVSRANELQLLGLQRVKICKTCTIAECLTLIWRCSLRWLSRGQVGLREVGPSRLLELAQKRCP